MARCRGYYTTRGISCTHILTTPVCKALCEHQRDHPSSPNTLRDWVLKKHMVDVSLVKLDQVLKHSSEYLSATETGEDESEESESESDEEDGDSEGSASGTLSDLDESKDDQNEVAVTLSDPDGQNEVACENGPVLLYSENQEKCPTCIL